MPNNGKDKEEKKKLYEEERKLKSRIQTKVCMINLLVPRKKRHTRNAEGQNVLIYADER